MPRPWSLLLQCNFPQKGVGWLGVPHGAEEETEAEGPDFPHARAQLSPSQTHPESRLGLEGWGHTWNSGLSWGPQTTYLAGVVDGRLRQTRRELLSPPQTLLPPWLVRDLEGGSRSLREPLKGKIEPFFSEGTWLWAGLRLQQLGRRQPRNSHFKLPPPLGPWSPGALLSWAPESGEDREKEGEAAGPGGVPKPKQWPKIITRRRIPAQKKRKTNYASLGAAGVTWSRRAAAAPAITHCVAHPTRGPLSGFFRGGGVSESEEGLLTALLLGDPSCPHTEPAQAPVSFPTGPISPLLPTRELPPEAPGRPHRIPARTRPRGTAEPGRGPGTPSLAAFAPSSLQQSLGPRLRARSTRRGGMKWEGERWAKTCGIRAPRAWGGTEGDS